MKLRPDKPCPCGSEFLLKECCLPDESPITERNQGYSQIIMNYSLVDEYGNQVIPRFGMKTNIEMRKPQQLSAQITNLIYSIIPKINESNILSDESAKYLHDIDDTLHACHYHKRQFLYRLRLLFQEEVLLNRPVRGNVIVELDDLPLRYEFEAFVTRIRVTLDVLAKFISSIIGNKKIKTNGDMFKFIHNPQNQKKHSELCYIYLNHEDWITYLRKMRDAVQHDGVLPGFKSFEYENGLTSNPSIDGLLANHVCFKYWRLLLSMIDEIFKYLFKSEK